MALSVTRLTVLCASSGTSVAIVHGATSHACLVADATVVVGGRRGSHLSIASTLGVLVSSPEWLATFPLGVVVGWRRTISLLFLVVLDE